MDGIAADKDYRGRGIGCQLLIDIVNYGTVNGFGTVRLDVIDANPGAKQLYERNGFIPIRVEKFQYLRWLLGFGVSTTMEARITYAAQKGTAAELSN